MSDESAPNGQRYLSNSGSVAGLLTQKMREVRNSEGILRLEFEINNQEQEELRIDSSFGMAINTIRNFSGRGNLIWGASTLDNNSSEWKFISFVRTNLMIKKDVQNLVRTYVFEPNNNNTWTSLINEISSYLTTVWKLGGLMGAKPEDAFIVKCGLGTTMEAEDVMNGILRVNLNLALTYPGNYSFLSIEQQQ